MGFMVAKNVIYLAVIISLCQVYGLYGCTHMEYQAIKYREEPVCDESLADLGWL